MAMCGSSSRFKARQLLLLVQLHVLSVVSSQRYYLPPHPPTLGLPEVIDVRARIPSTSHLQESATNDQPPALGLQTPYSEDAYPLHRFKGTDDQRAAAHHHLALLSNDVTVNEMSCRNSGDELYFRASLLPMKNFEHPVLENAGGGGSCKVLKHRSEYRVEFGKDEFWNCGVVDCSAESGRFYCLSLRFPAISGLRLKEDLKVTLQCRAQDKIASHTRRVNLKTIDTSARMAPRVAAGGNKNAFDTDVALYRKSFNSEHVFNAKIESGGTLLLGEEILLRAAVREGDGWKYSKMSDVTVHFVENRQRKKTTSSLWILDSEGCLNPQVRDICSGEQYRVGPLESYLLFKAFMFDNMQESDEMVLSVKVTGCLAGEDCVLNCPAGHARKARDVRAQDKSGYNGTFDWQNDITFRVVESMDRIGKAREPGTALPFVFALLALAIVAVAIFVVQLRTRRRREQFS